MDRRGAGKKVFIRTFGCQMNLYDSERMAETLAGDGYAETGRMDEADLVVLNTCHIREKAAEKVYSELGRVRQVKEAQNRAGRDIQVAVAGCVAQAEGAELTARAAVVDVVVGPQAYHRLPALLRRAAEGGQVVDTEFPPADKFASLKRRGTQPRRAPSAFLTVQEGCDKFCTFCVVPYTRGAEMSRPVAAVEAEARELVAGGVREITLLGQNVNAYHGADEAGGELGLGRLLFRLARIDGLERLRYTTSHPLDMDDALIAAHRDLEALMPYLHLPVQAGSDRVLRRMGRRHRTADYRAVVERLRRARPDLALSCDFIVGFPGETEGDFAETLALAYEIGFAQAFSFKYSARPGTPAAEMDGQVGAAEKTERLARLQALLTEQTRAFNAGTVGRTLPVLFERAGRHPGQLAGRTPYLQAVHVAAPRDLLGAIAEVRIAAAGPNSLAGELLAKPAPVREGELVR